MSLGVFQNLGIRQQILHLLLGAAEQVGRVGCLVGRLQRHFGTPDLLLKLKMLFA